MGVALIPDCHGPQIALMAGLNSRSDDCISLLVALSMKTSNVQGSHGVGQSVDVWFLDAVAHHLYRCEGCQQRRRLHHRSSRQLHPLHRLRSASARPNCVMPAPPLASGLFTRKTECLSE